MIVRRYYVYTEVFSCDISIRNPYQYVHERIWKYSIINFEELKH